MAAINQILQKYYHVEIEFLLAHVLNKPKEFLFMNREHELTQKEANELTRMVKRREKGEPIAYILGYKEFYGRKFRVNKHVLVPRPETEDMIDSILGVILNLKEAQSVKNLVQLSEPLPPSRKAWADKADAFGTQDDGTRVVKVLDVGTGSGCIAISLAKQLETSKIKFSTTASDISAKVLAVAKQNSKTHKANIKFVKSDLLKGIKGSFDVIIANLPYVPHSDYPKLKANLKYEPKNAIFEKENGLRLIKQLIIQIAQRTSKPKLIYLEFDPRQKVVLGKIIKQYFPLASSQFHKDFAGRWRFVEIARG